MIEASRSASTDSDNFGLFGTSIAATWLCGVLDDAVSFFVEEDPSRVGRLYMGRPVLRPDQAPSKSVVFLALVPEVALRVAERLRATTLDLRLPPE
jgi:hypothetical protein